MQLHCSRQQSLCYEIKIIVRSFGSSKNTKLEDGPYCTISGNEPSSVTLYKTGSESQTFCCNFKNLHLCSLNQRLKFSFTALSYSCTHITKIPTASWGKNVFAICLNTIFHDI